MVLNIKVKYLHLLVFKQAYHAFFGQFFHQPRNNLAGGIKFLCNFGIAKRKYIRF